VHHLTVDEDLALVGVVQPVQDVHQGALAGAVLAEQGRHLTTSHHEVDIVVGDDTREPFGDPA
jgi:hypothetical protein